jgi:hypothetical protein
MKGMRHKLRAPAWAGELDFVGPRARTAPWAWGLLLAGLLALAWVLPQLTQVEADLQEAQQTLKRLDRAAHQQAVAAQAPQVLPDKADLAPPLSGDSAQHAAQLAQWLAYPWMRVMDQVDAAAHGEQAVMLSFSLDLATLGSKPGVWPEVRVSAAVRDDASALRWAQAQGPSAQLLSRERLGTTFVAANGQYDWRAETSWAGGTP